MFSFLWSCDQAIITVLIHKYFKQNIFSPFIIFPKITKNSITGSEALYKVKEQPTIPTLCLLACTAFFNDGYVCLFVFSFFSRDLVACSAVTAETEI